MRKDFRRLGQRLALLANPKVSIREKLGSGQKLLAYWLKKILNLRVMQKPSVPAFVGWGMTSKAALPWDTASGSDLIGRAFDTADKNFKDLLLSGHFVLSQYETRGNNFEGVESLLKTKKYRHFYVFWSAVAASRLKSSGSAGFVEAGTCDGMTAYFADAALNWDNPLNAHSDFSLYDSWAPMESRHLTDSEKHRSGKYSYLSLRRTELNLSACERNFTFLQGYIPQIFLTRPGPESVRWLHIDLNSSLPTLKCLEHFLPRMVSGGIILFDDYGHGGYSETKEVVDDFFTREFGTLLPLPTGQSIFFKR